MNYKKGIFYVFIANVINLLMSLFTGFVLPKFLAIETYSGIKLFQLYTTYIGILHLGFIDGMYLKHGGENIEKINKKELLEELKTFKVFQIIVCIIAVIISIFAKNKILLYCSLVILPINVGSYLRSLYQSIGEFKKYSQFTNINTMLIFIINVILLLIVKSDNYSTYIIAYIIAYMIYWGIIENENRKIFKSGEKQKANINYLIKDIKAGFFLMIGNFCNVIFTSIDRLFVQNLLGTIKFAFYSFAVSIENLMSTFITPISTVMYNYLCNNRENEKVIVIKKLILLFATVIVTVIFPAKFVIDIWINKYSESLSVLFILFAAQFISIIVRCIHINLYKAQKRQNRYFIIMIAIVIVSIILNIILYLIYKSMVMIAIATLITNIIWFAIGELDFKNYRLKLSEYMYIFVILLVFLICGKINNAIFGLFTYLIVAFIAMVLLMNSTFKYCIEEVKQNYKKVIDKILKKNTP